MHICLIVLLSMLITVVLLHIFMEKVSLINKDSGFFDKQSKNKQTKQTNSIYLKSKSFVKL